jgi:hypothetical protein
MANFELPGTISTNLKIITKEDYEKIHKFFNQRKDHSEVFSHENFEFKIVTGFGTPSMKIRKLKWFYGTLSNDNNYATFTKAQTELLYNAFVSVLGNEKVFLKYE